jgi:hypothetical protein
MPAYAVIKTSPFVALESVAAADHPALANDLDWLIGRLQSSPETMGDRVSNLAQFALPIFKTRLKDSCHALGASGGWRIYYAIHKEKQIVFMLFIHHKKDYELPKRGFLLQKIERALPES